MIDFYGSGLAVYTHVIQERIAGEWEPIAYAEDFWMAQDILAEIEMGFPTPEGKERYRVLSVNYA
ncbi:hypothetical protein [Pseudomonas sp. MAG002Y]|uniref:hypothetical protein n=1 Tax=Pseudomonas sp. MAG002Y TaxID=2678690 RepID=UPI001C6091D6|nr:hypothetical protein [Pseudomonas sp. MAG002Y]MBW5416298.1 hypothetical protein [Pseudomonas sp. MAG002Y]